MNKLTDTARLLANYVRASRANRFSSRTALEQHQARKIAQWRQHTLSRSPFYAALRDAPLDAFPIMTKALMIAQFEAINTRGISCEQAFAVAEEGERTRDFSAMIGDVSVGLSTGTSGQRGLFLASRAERMRWAGMMLGRMLRGSLFGRHRIAFLLRANNQLYESVSGKGRIAFRFFDLKQPLDALHPDIAAFRPTIVIAPAQVLRELAHLEATPPAPGHDRLRPGRLISVAETLFDDDRALIEDVFESRVEQIYQATEGFLGYTCAAGRLHLNETFLHIEPDWIDEDQGLFAPIITDFSRETQPIVRYRLDDVLRLDARPCPCGSFERTLSRIEGRADDVLALTAKTPDGVRHVLPDFVALAIAGARSPKTGAPCVSDFRVCQTRANALSVRLQADDFAAARAGVAAALDQLCNEHSLEPVELAFEPMTPGDFMQKRRRIFRLEAGR